MPTPTPPQPRPEPPGLLDRAIARLRGSAVVRAPRGLVRPFAGDGPPARRRCRRSTSAALRRRTAPARRRPRPGRAWSASASPPSSTSRRSSRWATSPPASSPSSTPSTAPSSAATRTSAACCSRRARSRPTCSNVLLAAEDKNFYQHGGLDLGAIVRSSLIDLREGRLATGASTLTMQLARTYFQLSREKWWRRKVEEALLAVELEKRLSKEQILTLYCNVINLGEGRYGFKAASRTTSARRSPTSPCRRRPPSPPSCRVPSELSPVPQARGGAAPPQRHPRPRAARGHDDARRVRRGDRDAARAGQARAAARPRAPPGRGGASPPRGQLRRREHLRPRPPGPHHARRDHAARRGARGARRAGAARPPQGLAQRHLPARGAATRTPRRCRRGRTARRAPASGTKASWSEVSPTRGGGPHRRRDLHARPRRRQVDRRCDARPACSSAATWRGSRSCRGREEGGEGRRRGAGKRPRDGARRRATARRRRGASRRAAPGAGDGDRAPAGRVLDRRGARDGRRLGLLAQPVQPRHAGEAPGGLGVQAVRLRRRDRGRLHARRHAVRRAGDLPRRRPARSTTARATTSAGTWGSSPCAARSRTRSTSPPPSCSTWSASSA